MNKSEYQLIATSERHRAAAGFWRAQLSGVDDAVAAIRGRGAAPPGVRATIALPLSATAVRAIGKLSADPLGRFTVAAAGVALAAARFFNRSNTVLRAPVLLEDGETASFNAEHEVPLVFAVDDDAPLRQFLEASARVVEQSYELQDFPIGMLFDEERAASLVGHLAFSISSAALHGSPIETAAALHIDADAIADGRIAIDFDPSIVEPFLVGGLTALVAETFDRFADLSTAVRDIDRAPVEQRQRLIVEWNRTDTPLPFRSAVSMFEEQAVRAPDAIALRFGGETITYQELNGRANALARFLIDTGGSRSGPAIAIWMNRSPAMVTSVLGVLKAGLAYLPIDAECPQARLASILKDAGVCRALVDESHHGIIEALGCDAILPDGAASSAIGTGLEVAASDLAYLIYTSGSTGEPKGCAIEHGSLSNYLQWAIGHYWSDPAAGSMGLFSPLSFDLTVTSVFCPLLRGRTLTIFAQDAPIVDVLQQQFDPGSGVDSIKLTPSHIRLLEPERLRGTNIRLAIVGGEALTTEQVGILKRIDPRIRIVNEYGPTEATVGCVVRDMEAGEPILIGRPIANARIYVLDDDQRLVAVGVRGEICIAGAGLARGYHAREALTASRFVDDPFKAGERMYRTGDIGRWLANGEIECFGRLDGQVKIRGYRIELGEVESALRRCAGVREAVVVPREDRGEVSLVAYLENDGAIDSRSLRRALAATLPEYMVPSAFVQVAALPLTANGKVDKARLPRYSAASRSRATYVEPHTPVERTVARIWEETFGLESIGLGENFFDLGGHSLRAMDMMRRIYQAFGVEVSVGEVLSNPSVAALAAVIERRPQTAIAAIPRVAAAEHYPLSHGQRSLWVINRIEDGSAAYNVSSTFDLRGPLDAAALAQAFRALIARHASLRTIFIEVDGEPRQRVLADMPLTIEELDLRGVTGSGTRLQVLVEQQAALVFDLSRGPLLRVGVYRMEESRTVLAITLHHIVSDEWSLRVLITEVVELYEASRTNAERRLAPLPIQYPDYAAWQREQLASPASQPDREHWLSALSGELAPLDLPADFARPAIQTYRGHHHRFVVDARQAALLRAIGARHGASPFITLVALVKVLLFRYTGQADVRVGAPIAGRTRDELASQIGFFVNTLVLRDELRGDEAFGVLLDRVKQTAEGAYTHQAYPFDRLVEELETPRDLSRSPLFDVMVAYETDPGISLAASGLTVEEMHVESGVAKFDLTLAFAEADGALDVEIEYNRDLFAADRIERMAGHLRQLVDSVIGDETLAIERLAILPEAEQRQVLTMFNDTAVGEGADETLVSLFERQAGATPDGIAIVHGDRQLTYRGLDEQVNRFAHHLITDEGVAPGDRVAVQIDRSVDMVVALLGILKAGAAYVPIDPGDPEQRVAFIAADAGVKTIVRDVSGSAAGPVKAPAHRAAPHDLAYVLYTSGSTGQPKGVMVEHGAVANALQFVRRKILGASGRRQAACAPYTFDVSVQEIFGSLVHGNTVDIVPDDIRRDPQRLIDFLSSRAIDMLDGTPSFFSAMLEAGLAGRDDVRVADYFMGAEALSPDLLDRYYANGAHRDVRITNFYGPTECTINATWWSTDGRGERPSSIPIGAPIDNVRIYVLDAQLQPSPLGVPGEIWISGAGVARGYLNQPELSARVFVADPFQPGARMYRSGDRGRWRADGMLEFIARIDEQVKIRGYRIEPAEIEQALRRHPSVRDAVVLPFADGSARKLVAFVVSRTDAVADSELREFLAGTLAAYMIPAEFVTLAAPVLTASGKIDRRSVRERYESGGHGDAPAAIAKAPRDERERLLVGVMESVLGRTGVGVDDNFFHVGGDSIKAIQVVNRLARQGWTLRVRDLFEAPRLEQLARRLDRASAPPRPRTAAGASALTPMQRWFFRSQTATRSHYNQSVMLRFADGLEEASLRQVGRAIVRQHEALRTCYRVDGETVTPFPVDPYDPVEVRDLRNAADPTGEVQRQAAAVQVSLDVERGPIARFVLFHLPDGDRLLAVIHHLAVDGVSWRILLEDLRLGLRQQLQGDEVDLGAASDPFPVWTAALAELAGAAGEERAWWDDVTQAPTTALPYDDREGAALEAGAREHRITLSAADTDALLIRVHRAYNTRTNDVLLAALARALGRWAGPGAVRVDLESHGREGVEAVDVTRTVGWFTALYPVLLDLGGETDEGAQIKIVKESLRRTPGHGLGYGLLRGSADPASPILFNFLGQFDTDIDGFEMAVEERGPEHGPLAVMSHDLEIGGWISEGRANLTVRYSPARFADATIARFAKAYQAALEQLIAHCRNRQARERTASDYRYRDASTPALLARLGAHRVEDIYPLSPMQQGMLFHDVLAGDTPAYIQQFSCAITGAFDESAFRRAWDEVIDRHPVLRTAFFWNDVEQPLQVVFSEAQATWTLEGRVEDIAREHREGPLDLAEAPLMRFALIREAGQAWRFCWTSHHILLDGWSSTIVLQEVFACYEAAVRGRASSLPAVRPFGDYIDWLRAQDPSGIDAYWRDRLRGFTAPTPLPYERHGDAVLEMFGRAELALPAETSAGLAAAARDHHLTLNTIVRGAWALLLGRQSRQDDVVFGAIVAGRPAALPDVDAMVGLFINTLPIRVRLDRSLTLVEWLRRLQVEQADLDRYAASSLAEIQRVSEVPRRAPLFDSILAFQNYPVDQAIDPGASDLAIDTFDVVEHTNYPLTVSVVPGEEIVVRLSYDQSRIDDQSAQRIVDEMRALFDAFVTDPRQRLDALLPGGGRRDAPELLHTFELDPPAAAALRELSARLEAPPSTVARAIAALLSYRYSASEDLRCVAGDALVARDAIQGDGRLAALLQSASTGVEGSADLRFAIDERSGRLIVAVSSETGRFDRAFLERTGTHMAEAIHNLQANPLEVIDRVNILPERERARVLRDFNQTAVDWGSARTIAEMFETQAAAVPERVAVLVPALDRADMSRDQAWTYRELNARANQLARALVSRHGVGPDVRVGVLAERSLDLVLALLAVAKAGGAYVPLDPEYPRELLRFMLADSGAAVILTQSKFSELAAEYQGPVISLDTGWSAISAETEGNLPSRASGDDLAYVIYTSGSTGRPKGAMNTHRGIVNRLLWMQDADGLTERDRVLQKTPFSFDVSVWEFFWPLISGAQLVLAKPGGHRDPSYLARLIEAARISTVHFVPSMLQAFIEEPGVERCGALTRVVCSGEALSPELLRRYWSRLDVPLHNLYGPTETAVEVTAWRANRSDALTMVPIGRPIANTQIYILDGMLQPVPEGVSGELFIGGVQVGRGYLNRPELTAEKFIPDPFGGGKATLYRSGDMARFRADGTIDFLGRFDHQVKLRGFRIELGEIESALLTHAGVRQCVAVVREDTPGSRQLVAYVVPAAGAAMSTDDLRRHLLRLLPGHMVPAVIISLPELPHLLNGKLDRTALPPPYDFAAHHVAPRGPFERRLTAVWERVLGVQEIGVTDDFFDLGGHSILAIKLVSAIQSEFGRALPLAQLLANPTVERLAAMLQADDGAANWRPLVALKRGGSEPPLFLLPGAGGNVIYFHALAQHLSESRSIYGLQALGLDGHTPPQIRVEAIAALNIEEMRRAAPSGPYFLAGHSFGGRVALEIAQQLRQQGQAVGLLAIFDTPAPTFEPLAAGDGWSDAHWLARIAREIGEFFGVRLDVSVEQLQPLPADEQVSHVADRMQRAGVWAAGADPSQLRGYLQVYKANTQTPFARYDAPAAVPIALFKALESDADEEEAPAGLIELTTQAGWGWERFALDGVRVYDVPGAHLSMLAEPQAPALARALDEALHAATTSWRSSAGTTP